MTIIRRELSVRSPEIDCSLSAVLELSVPQGTRLPWSSWLYSVERALSYMLEFSLKSRQLDLKNDLSRLSYLVKDQMIPRAPMSCISMNVTDFTFISSYQIGKESISFAITLFWNYKGNLKATLLGDVKDASQDHADTPGLHTTSDGRIRLCADKVGKKRGVQKDKHSDCKV